MHTASVLEARFTQCVKVTESQAGDPRLPGVLSPDEGGSRARANPLGNLRVPVPCWARCEWIEAEDVPARQVVGSTS